MLQCNDYRSVRAQARWIFLLGVSLALWAELLPPGSARAAPEMGVEKVLYLGARAAPDGAAALSRRLVESLDRALATALSRAGTGILRPQRGELGSCAAADYRCILRASSQRGELLLDLTVQKNDPRSYYVTMVFLDSKNPDEATSESLSYLSEPDDAAAPKSLEDGLAAVVADKVAGFLARWQRGPAAAPQAVRPTLPRGKVKLSLQAEGPGQITAEPPQLLCGVACDAEYPRTEPPPRVTLLARPQGAASLLGWSEPGCAADKPCTLFLAADTQVTARFGRSRARKVLTGVLGGLGLAGAIASGVLFSLVGSDAGVCTVNGITSTGCVRNSAPAGGIVLGLAALFGTGSALGWWLPVSGSRKWEQYQ